MAAAAAVVSVSMGVMKPVLSKLTTLMGDEYKKIKGLRKMVAFLQRELRDMDALLEKMENVADELDPQAQNWRNDIIDMSYDIEDCIDDFMQRVGEANDKGLLKKAFRYLKTFKDRHDLANQFQEMKTRVMEASERRKRYMLDQCISMANPAVIVDPRITALYKESASLVGIDAQKEKLVNWAMDEDKQLKVMAIVGHGGLGKTTLANEVYRGVGEKFDCKCQISSTTFEDIYGIRAAAISSGKAAAVTSMVVLARGRWTPSAPRRRSATQPRPWLPSPPPSPPRPSPASARPPPAASPRRRTKAPRSHSRSSPGSVLRGGGSRRRRRRSPGASPRPR